MKSEQIKILLLTHYYPLHRGGVEIVAGKLIQTLVDHYSIFGLWIASDTDMPPQESLYLRYDAVKAINIIERNFQIPYPIWTIPALIKIWNSIRNSDLVHIHDYLYFGNIFAFIFSKIQEKPLVITQHIGLIPYESKFLRQLLSQLNQKLGSPMLSSAHQVVFISEEVKKYFSGQTRFRNPPLLIANGVDTDVFYPVSSKEVAKIRINLGYKPEDIIFLFVGRFVEKKGLNVLSKLAQLFPDVCWCFVGWGGLDPEQWGLPNARVFKNLTSIQLVPIYQMADLLVLPSKGEGFPLVVQEAMACGTPVMVNPEVAMAHPQAAPLMFAVPVDGTEAIAEWSKQLEFVCSNPAILQKLRPQVAAFAQHHWSWHKCAQQYYQIFEKYRTVK